MCAYRLGLTDRVTNVCVQIGTDWQSDQYVCLQIGTDWQWPICVPTDSLKVYEWILLCSWNWNSTKMEVCQNVTVYHWASRSWCFQGLSSLQNVRNFSPNIALSHPRRHDLSAALLLEPQISWSSINVTHIHSKVFFGLMPCMLWL